MPDNVQVQRVLCTPVSSASVVVTTSSESASGLAKSGRFVIHFVNDVPCLRDCVVCVRARQRISSFSWPGRIMEFLVPFEKIMEDDEKNKDSNRRPDDWDPLLHVR